jgi:hypothetical protein
VKKIMLFLIVAVVALTPVCAQALSVGDWGGWPTLGLQFGDKFAGYLGYSNFGAVGGGSSTSTMLAKVDCNLAKLGDVQTKLGVFYQWVSPGSGTTLGLTWGVAIMPVNNLSLGFDIVLAQSNSSPSSTDILPSAVFTANLAVM